MANMSMHPIRVPKSPEAYGSAWGLKDTMNNYYITKSFSLPNFCIRGIYIERVTHEYHVRGILPSKNIYIDFAPYVA